MFHLFGYAQRPESLVLTQHDYLQFLENISRDNKGEVLPDKIGIAIMNNYLLFLGYSFFDLHFLFLLQALDEKMKKNLYNGGKCHVSVQMVGMGSKDEQQAEKYLQKYFDWLDIAVCWGTCDQFIIKLEHFLGNVDHGR